MKIWAHTVSHSEGKFLVIRRDGSVPAWPHFVIGARDPGARAALLAYAKEHEWLGTDPEYVISIRKLAKEFDDYRKQEGNGDPEAPPHRKDDPAVIAVMHGSDGTINAWQSENIKKA